MGRIQAKTRLRKFNVREEISAVSSTILTKRENGKEEDPVLFLMKREGSLLKSNKHIGNRKSQRVVQSPRQKKQLSTSKIWTLLIIDQLFEDSPAVSRWHIMRRTWVFPRRTTLHVGEFCTDGRTRSLLSSNAEAAPRDRLRTASVESKIFQIGFSHSRNNW